MDQFKKFNRARADGAGVELDRDAIKKARALRRREARRFKRELLLGLGLRPVRGAVSGHEYWE